MLLQSLLRFLCAESLKEVPCGLRYIEPLGKAVGQTVHLFNEFFLILALPGSDPSEQFIEDDADRKYVAEGRVHISDE